MTKIALILAGVFYAIAPAYAGPVYGAGSNGDLYTVNPATGATTLVGAMGTTMYDIAEYDGELYGISSASDLYSINTTTGHATEIGSDGEELNALTFNSSGVLYAAGVTEDSLYTINLSTGAATAVGNNGSAYDSAGDLQFIGNTLYMTTGGGGTNAPSSLATVNTTTGVVTTVGAIDLNNVGGTAVDDVFGLVVYNGLLYGFTSPSGTGEVITINPSNAVATDVDPYGGGSFTFYGTTSDAIPEPATASFILIGLAAFYWSRKSS